MRENTVITQNLALLKRLQGQSSEYNKHKLMKDDKDRLKLLRNISKFHQNALFPVPKCKYQRRTPADESKNQSRRSSQSSAISKRSIHLRKKSEYVNNNLPKLIKQLKVNA